MTSVSLIVVFSFISLSLILYYLNQHLLRYFDSRGMEKRKGLRIMTLVIKMLPMTLKMLMEMVVLQLLLIPTTSWIALLKSWKKLSQMKQM